MDMSQLGRSRVAVHHARAQLIYGEWLRRERRRIDAREQLKVAYAAFDAMGADAFAERAQRELLATGETVRKRTADTHEALTPQEAQIGRLAHDGLTNPEIGEQLFLTFAPSNGIGARFSQSWASVPAGSLQRRCAARTLSRRRCDGAKRDRRSCAARIPGRPDIPRRGLCLVNL